MADREKAIKGLECCIRHGENAEVGCGQKNECPYEVSGLKCWLDLNRDALTLLKEQEHKDKIFHALEDDWKRLKELLKEQKRKKGSWDYGTQCSVCKGTIIPPKDRKIRVNFCPWCGADMRDSYEQ